MLRPRVIVCLDVKDGRVVKGTQFKNLRDVGDPVELARRYEEEGADEIVVEDELVAALHQEVAGGALDAAADDSLVVFLQFGNQRRKIAVSRQQRENIDVLFRITEIDGVHYHVNVGAVLAADPGLGNIDHLHAVGVKFLDVGAELAPVAVSPLVNDSPFLQQPLQDQLDVELGTAFQVPDAEGQVLEIYKYRD